jgi:hypothetical protein
MEYSFVMKLDFLPTPFTALLLGIARSSEICAGIEFLSTHMRSLDLTRFGREFSVPYIRIRRGASRLLGSHTAALSFCLLVHRLLM